jgi:squalene-associated FAD-dependent desaturase
VVEALWEPLCVATLNTPVAEASARVFLRVLGDAFGRRREDSHLLIPRDPLGALFPEPAAARLRERGHRVETGRRVVGLQLRFGDLAGVAHSGGVEPAEGVALALPPAETARLLAGVPHLAATVADIEALGSQPISTVYLRYPEGAALPRPLVGLAGRVGQWLFDHGHLGRPGLMAVVISAAGAHARMGRGDLGDWVADELAHQFPGWPPPRDHYVIREKRATFSCTVAGEARRPTQETPLPGLWLAGDYTRTPYPATLEGAVRSGLQCARGLHRQLAAG